MCPELLSNLGYLKDSGLPNYVAGFEAKATSIWRQGRSRDGLPFHLLRGSEPPSHQGSSSSHLASLKSFSPKRGFFIYTDVLQAFLPKARKNGPSARIFIVGVHGRNRTCDLPLRRRSLYPLSYVDSGPIIAPRPLIMKKKEKAGTQGMPAFFRDGRNDGVRTRDLLVPNQAHYQAVLRPVATGAVSNIALSKPLG